MNDEIYKERVVRDKRNYPVMTHDELLLRLDDYGFGVPPLNALRAVVKLHKPISTGSCQICVTSEGHSILFPCPTIQAIEKELG